MKVADYVAGWSNFEEAVDHFLDAYNEAFAGREGRWCRESLEILPGSRVAIEVSRYCCGDSDYESLTVPVTLLDLERAELVRVLKDLRACDLAAAACRKRRDDELRAEREQKQVAAAEREQLKHLLAKHGHPDSWKEG